MAKGLLSATISRAEIDQRSRQSLRHLEHVEVLLVPGFRMTRSWMNLWLNPLLRCWPGALLGRHGPTASSKY